MGESKKNNEFNTLPRVLESGDLVLPCACAMVIKKIEHFDTVNATVGICSSFILRIKITGFEDCKAITDHIENHLCARINDSSFCLMEDLGGNLKKTHSSHSKDGKIDMFQITVRSDNIAMVSFKDFKAYPFDTLKCTMMFEFSHFEAEIDGKRKQVRFDIYHQPNSISFKPGCDMLTEHDIDFKSIKMDIVMESKGDSNDDPMRYYPRFDFKMNITRDPA